MNKKNDQTIELYVRRIIDIIRQRMGLIIHPHQKNELVDLFLSACKKFNYTPDEYVKILNLCTSDSPIMEHLVVGVTVGETYFFRDKKQMDLLQTKILPELIKKKRQEKDLSLRIWSAGCASGEEIYTIAIILDQIINDIDAWTINLLGTDINTESLKKAIGGLYNDWSMRSISEEMKLHYFTLLDGKYALNEKIRNRVRFEYLNLNDNTYPSIFNGTNSQDLILCRNVLIYFDKKATDKLMLKFHACLQSGGYLVLGASDPIDIKLVNTHYDYLDNMLLMRRVFEKQKLTRPVKPKSPEPVVIKQEEVRKIDYDKRLLELISKSQWHDILLLLDNLEDKINTNAFYLYAKAISLANIGNLEPAVVLFQSSLKIDPTNKYCHFMYALTLLELNQSTKAEDELRKTLFLDRKFVISYYQLGLLLLRNRNITAGLKCLNNAYVISVNKNPTELVHGSQGLTYGRLSEILEHEIAMYGVEDYVG
jgi:chemotaxis protein methyltransferase CheR